MSIRIFLTALVLLFFSGSVAIASDYVPDELLVKYKPGFYPEGEDSYLKKIGWAVVKTESKRGFTTTRARLKKDPRIARVDYNYYGGFISEPNDPEYDQQWYLPNIQAPDAWDISLGEDAVIGLIDSGIDFTHPDLTANILSDGYDFGDSNDDPTDQYGHGTKVGGVIAAIQNNSLGISGVAPQGKILPIKVSQGSTGTLTGSSVAEAIIYTTDKGARIINLSLFLTDESPVVSDAVAYAVEAGVILVAAAGQDGGGAVRFPARLEDVIAVSATDDTDELWSKSNYGPEIDLSAPGKSIYTTKRGGIYTTESGTSFSSAMISAVTALLIAHYPGLTRDQVRERLFAGVDDLGNAGKDEKFGYGKINALKVLQPGDADGDGILDDEDNCPYDNNPFQEDEDTDGVGDICDNCPETPNGPDEGTCTEVSAGSTCMNSDDCTTGGFCSMEQEDTDGDGTGDACEVITTTTIQSSSTTSTGVSTTTTSVFPCLATETYGEHSEEVLVLRYIRDHVLSKSPEGREITRLYYELSPVITVMMKNDNELRRELQRTADKVFRLIIGSMQ